MSDTREDAIASTTAQYALYNTYAFSCGQSSRVGYEEESDNCWALSCGKGCFTRMHGAGTLSKSYR